MTTTISEADLLRRRLPLAGTFNLRDIGGYEDGRGRSTRWRTLLRGDALHRLDEAGRSALARLGVRTVIDLRQDTERLAEPDRLEGVGARIVHMPLYDGELRARYGSGPSAPAPTLADIYTLLVTDRGGAIAAAIRELARPDAVPAIVHCTAGKDRTGIVVALVLGSLGMPDDVIAADFSATGLFLGDEFRRLLSQRTEMLEADPATLASMLGAEPELIRDTLARVREDAGDVRGYLTRHGVTEVELDALRDRLMETNEGDDTHKGVKA
jgi:protein-tyrosine phosphatase